jgi:hypothetical protein
MVLHNHRRLPVSNFCVKIAALGSLKVSKEEAKTWSLICSSTKKQKIVKIISACIGESTNLIKNYTILLKGLGHQMHIFLTRIKLNQYFV